jgi:hypothetical protein
VKRRSNTRPARPETRGRTGPGAVLIALLDQRHPDPVDHLGIDRATVRSHLEQTYPTKRSGDHLTV